MAKLMVMIDVPEMEYEELQQRMLNKQPHSLVDFSFPQKSPDGLALVIVDKEVLEGRPTDITGLVGRRYGFELIGVRP